MTLVACAVRGASFFLARLQWLDDTIQASLMYHWSGQLCSMQQAIGSFSTSHPLFLLSPLEKINVCHPPLTHEYGLRQLADLA